MSGSAEWLEVSSHLGEDIIFKDLLTHVVTIEMANGSMGTTLVTENNDAFVTMRSVGAVIKISAQGEISFLQRTGPIKGKLLYSSSVKVNCVLGKVVEEKVAEAKRGVFPSTPGIYTGRENGAVFDNTFIIVPENPLLEKLYLSCGMNGSLEKLYGDRWTEDWAFHKVLSGIKFLVTLGS